MDILKLTALGAISKGDLIRKSVEWKHTDDDRNEVVTEFDVFIKREASAADFEFIFRTVKDGSLMARRVSKLIRLGETGEEIIEYKTAELFQPSLLLALCQAINEVEKENGPIKVEGESEKN